MILKSEVYPTMDSKTLAFTALMGALGNIIFLVSSNLPIAPGVTLDFSLIPVFIAGIYGGPLAGFLSGLFAGIGPGISYGPLSPFGSWLALIGLPAGKALSGLTSGLLYKIFDLNKRRHSSLLSVPSVLFSYIPEAIFTVVYFVFLLPFFVGAGIGASILVAILIKAWAEILIISFFPAAVR